MTVCRIPLGPILTQREEFRRIVALLVGDALLAAMDPFVFDQKFARFLSQLDSGAIREGTELYEDGKGSLRNTGSSLFSGSVADGKDEVFSVRLTENDDGGFSGSCSCDEFFNCRHSYTIARLARDQMLGPSGGIEVQPNTPVNMEDQSELVERLGSDASSEEKKVCEAIERLWKIAEQNGFLLYPKDLKLLVATGPQNGLIAGQPLRALKVQLESADLESPAEFADFLKCYFEYKGINSNAVFTKVARSAESKIAFESVAKSIPVNTSWKEEALKFRYELHMEPASERDWFRISAKGAVEGGGYSDQEVKLLLATKGGLVNLPDKGWRRMRVVEDEELAAIFATVGIDPVRGNNQRIHAIQLEDLLSGDILADPNWSAAVQRAKDLQGTHLPTPPKALAGVLRPYQIEGFRYLCRLSDLEFGGILADDMGLGKTLQTLAWLLWQKERLSSGVGLRVLIVCPKSVTDNWIREPEAFNTGLSSTQFRTRLIGNTALAESNLVVANYAQLRIKSDYFLSERWDVVVLDEGQYIKSPSSQTTKVAWKLKAEQRLILTGTPIENRLTDLWSLLRFAMPKLLGPQAAFATNYNLTRNPNALEGLRKRIQPFMLRRLKHNVAKDLPARIEKEIYCELEGEQRALYEQELVSARALLKDSGNNGGSGGLNVLQSLLRMRQICCDPQLVNKDALTNLRSSKVGALIDIVEPLVEERHKVLVFSQFVSMLEIIERELEKCSIASLKLTGKTQNRKELVDRFQNEKSESVFLLSLRAAGSGLNLTAASYVILFDPWWNPAVEAQAIDRTHRIGQESKVIAYRILAKNTVEEKIREIQNEKSKLADSVIGEGELAGSLSLDAIAEILG